MLFAPEPPQTTKDKAAELQALMTLVFTPQVGPRSIEILRQKFGSARQALTASHEALKASKSINAKALATFGQVQYSQKAQEEITRCQQANITLLGRGLPSYPAALDALQDPPPVLWVRGKLPELGLTPLSLGVVGTRAASPHALKMARQISGELAAMGVIVISGLARGIDTAAHTGAVTTGGQSIAILGSAVNHIYPRENSQLAEQLCLISEYPLGTGPLAHHFPSRNRIIAALSAGVWVVEGQRKSGSLITANHALDCGRTVFAMPGLAGDPRASGPHQLIRDGAVLTECGQDILQEMNWKAAPIASTQLASAAATPDKVPALTQPQPKLPQLTDNQLVVWQSLQIPRTLDDLQEQSQLKLEELQTILVLLQLEGLLTEIGGRWQRC